MLLRRFEGCQCGTKQNAAGSPGGFSGRNLCRFPTQGKEHGERNSSPHQLTIIPRKTIQAQIGTYLRDQKFLESLREPCDWAAPSASVTGNTSRASESSSTSTSARARWSRSSLIAVSSPMPPRPRGRGFHASAGATATLEGGFPARRGRIHPAWPGPGRVSRPAQASHPPNNHPHLGSCPMRRPHWIVIFLRTPPIL